MQPQKCCLHSFSLNNGFDDKQSFKCLLVTSSISFHYFARIAVWFKLIKMGFFFLHKEYSSLFGGITSMCMIYK